MNCLFLTCPIFLLPGTFNECNKQVRDSSIVKDGDIVIHLFHGFLSTIASRLGCQHLRRARTLVVFTILLSATALAAWQLSKLAAEDKLTREMYDMRHQNDIRLEELRAQVSDTFVTMNSVVLTEISCSDPVREKQVGLIQKWRYITNVMTRMRSGVVCDLYDNGISEKKIPVDGNGFYDPGTGRKYWFMSGQGVSKNDGEVVIQQGSTYIWINKGALLDILDIPEGFLFSLFDQKNLQPLFSNEEIEFKLLAQPKHGILQRQNSAVYISHPSRWIGAFYVQAVSMEFYQKIRLQTFAILIMCAFALAIVTYFLASALYDRLFSIQARFRKALSDGSLNVRYQPIVDLSNGSWCGAEALLRWSLDGVNVPPSVFIPLAEKRGLIGQVTRLVLRRVAEDLSSHLLAKTQQYISINVSAIDLNDEQFANYVIEIFSEHGVSLTRIVIEVTESACVNIDCALRQLKLLRASGCKVAIDDFGTGYSNIASLAELPFDILKIDRSFIATSDFHSKWALWRAVADIAASLGLVVVAEGVECDCKVAELSRARVMLAQGWFYSRDLAVEELAKGFLKCQCFPEIAA